jgi:hypothetical protein
MSAVDTVKVEFNSQAVALAGVIAAREMEDLLQKSDFGEIRLVIHRRNVVESFTEVRKCYGGPPGPREGTRKTGASS